MNTRIRSLPFAALLAALLLGAGCSKAPEVAAVPPAGSAHVGNVSDIDVTEHVKTALLQSESLKGFDITVVTTSGDIRLTGVVETQAQADEAIRIARAAEGAHTIHDELTLKK